MACVSAKRASRPFVLGSRLGERGAVYVEFLIVFMPLFLLFLTVCQFALLAAARLVVQHSALSAARSAIVVLEDDPNRYGGAPRGSLSKGTTTTAPSFEQALASLIALPWLNSNALAPPPRAQQGTRMAPIREAAEFPLIALAPREDMIVRPENESVATSLDASAVGHLVFALGYTRAAAVITVHLSGSDDLAAEPVDRHAAVSVHVTYLYACGVPIVRALICRSLSSLLGAPHSPFPFGIFGGSERSSLGQRFDLAEDPGGLERIAGPGSFFAPLSGEATLPNQGAAYEGDS
ncbi:MAG: TadE family protein [Polyangiaceae bacterium]